MDNIRDSFSKMKKGFKHRLTGRKRKPDGTGADPSGERADLTTSIPQPESHAVAGESYNREGDRVNAAGEQVSSTDPPPQPDGPESVPPHGSDNGQEEGETEVDGGEASQRDSHTRPEIEVATGSGHSGELDGVYDSLSSPSTMYSIDSTWTSLFLPLALIVPSDTVGTSDLPDHEPEVVRLDETPEPSVAPDEKESDCKPTASATAELLRGVIDSPGGFGPLKSVARSLCSILDNCDVWSPSSTFDSQCLRSL